VTLRDLLSHAESHERESRESGLPWWLDPAGDDTQILLTIAAMIVICVVVQVGIYFKLWLL
jgi:hypothetical protein